MLENSTHSLLSFSLYSIKTEHGVYKRNRGFNLTTYQQAGKGKKGKGKRKETQPYKLEKRLTISWDNNIDRMHVHQHKS
jgi:hypothetical protein